MIVYAPRDSPFLNRYLEPSFCRDPPSALMRVATKTSSSEGPYLIRSIKIVLSQDFELHSLAWAASLTTAKQVATRYRIRVPSPRPVTGEPWVFWVHASNTARFEQSFQDIASCVKISGRQNLQANIFQLVHDWLRDDKKGKWALKLDNFTIAYELF